MVIIRLGKNLTAQEHTGTSVTNCQGITSGTVSGANPALEVGTPDTIGPISTQEWLRPRADTPPALASGNHPMQTKNPSASTHRRPGTEDFRGFIRTRREFGWTPSRMGLFGPYHRQHYISWCSSGTSKWCPGALIKSRNAFIIIAPQPLVGCFTTHLELSRQLLHSILSSFVKAYHLQSFFHGTGLFPRQGSHLLACKLPVTYVFSKYVTSVAGL